MQIVGGMLRVMREKCKLWWDYKVWEWDRKICTGDRRLASQGLPSDDKRWSWETEFPSHPHMINEFFILLAIYSNTAFF